MRLAKYLVALLVAVGLSTSAWSQSNQDLGAVLTNALRPAGTVTTQQLTNTNNKGVACRFVQTASSGSPSTTFAIQTYDTATNSYVSVVTSGAITDTTPTEITAYPNATLTTTPSGWVLNAVPLGLFWRVTQTIAGSSGPATTSRIGCRLFN